MSGDLWGDTQRTGFYHRRPREAHVFAVIWQGFSLFTTLSDTGTERSPSLLVSHLRVYSPESASERGGSAISPLPFLVKNRAGAP